MPVVEHSFNLLYIIPLSVKKVLASLFFLFPLSPSLPFPSHSFFSFLLFRLTCRAYFWQDLRVSKSLKVLPSEVALAVCLSQIHMHGFRQFKAQTFPLASIYLVQKVDASGEKVKVSND